ncbi:MAG: adenosylcobinamide-GDP ribazoletransferase [Paracoccus sp. (in: a-proteobacteria)]
MVRLEQLVLALVFLTRLPLGRALPARILPLRASAWSFPLAGAVVGAVASLPLLLPGPALLTATLSLALSVWFTGGLHEDGLADFADAGGGRDREERLRIMRDSRIGSYGVLALIATSALRIAALTVLGPVQLIVAASCARTGIVLTMASMHPARPDGLSKAAGAPGARNVIAALLIALAALALAGQGALLALLAAMAVIAFVIIRARIWLGGQTGDVLGAASVLTETAMLVAFALTGAA